MMKDRLGDDSDIGLEFLDEHYPPEVFVGSSGDPGPRIVALTRALDRSRAELASERDETSIGSLAETVKVWHERFTDLQAEHVKAGESWDRQRARLDARIDELSGLIEIWQEIAANYLHEREQQAAMWIEAAAERDAAESSRRDWAAEAMRLEMENERLREALPVYLKLLDLAEASIAGVVMDTDDDRALQVRVLTTLREGKERIATVSRPVCAVHPTEEAQ